MTSIDWEHHLSAARGLNWVLLSFLGTRKIKRAASGRCDVVGGAWRTHSPYCPEFGSIFKP